tara:strand:- start:283 stop:636 length:354 start_codon:yes stop_codon:yes gene_type:complete
MLKILDKKTFKEIPKKEQDIFIQQGAEQQQEMFSAEESHQGLTWKDYIPEIKQHCEDKYNGEDGKESFIYLVNKTDSFEYKGKNYSTDKTYWKQGDHIDWETDFMTKEQLQDYAESC